MSEPKNSAGKVERITDRLWHWTVQDDRLRFRSDAFAVGDSPVVLIDPLPLSDQAFSSLPPVEAIVLTVAVHQRSCWRFRRRLGVEVWAPKGAMGLEEEPDSVYDEDTELPLGLDAFRIPGPKGEHYALLDSIGGVVWVGDLLLEGPDHTPQLLPDEHVEDPRAAKQSLRRIAEQSPRWLCCAHGPPWKEPLALIRSLIG